MIHTPVAGDDYFYDNILATHHLNIMSRCHTSTTVHVRYDTGIIQYGILHTVYINYILL